MTPTDNNKSNFNYSLTFNVINMKHNFSHYNVTSSLNWKTYLKSLSWDVKQKYKK